MRRGLRREVVRCAAGVKNIFWRGSRHGGALGEERAVDPCAAMSSARFSTGQKSMGTALLHLGAVAMMIVQCMCLSNTHPRDVDSDVLHCVLRGFGDTYEYCTMEKLMEYATNESDLDTVSTCFMRGNGNRSSGRRGRNDIPNVQSLGR